MKQILRNVKVNISAHFRRQTFGEHLHKNFIKPIFRNANIQTDYTVFISKFKQILSEECQNVQQPKHCKHDNKDEDNGLNNVNNINIYNT